MVISNLIQKAEKKGYIRKYSQYVLDNTRAQSTEDELNYIELCLLQRWLRDNKNLAVLVHLPYDIFYTYSVDGINGNGTYTDSSYKEKKDFNTYVEALIEGLSIAIEGIK